MTQEQRDLEAKILGFFNFLRGMQGVNDMYGDISYITIKYKNYFGITEDFPPYLGLDAQFIPEKYINHSTYFLEDRDMIEGLHTKELLIYSKPNKAYQLVTDNPCCTFLSNPYQEWRKK